MIKLKDIYQLKVGDIFSHTKDSSTIYKVFKIDEVNYSKETSIRCKRCDKTGLILSDISLFVSDVDIYLLSKRKIKSNKPIWF